MIGFVIKRKSDGHYFVGKDPDGSLQYSNGAAKVWLGEEISGPFTAMTRNKIIWSEHELVEVEFKEHALITLTGRRKEIPDVPEIQT